MRDRLAFLLATVASVSCLDADRATAPGDAAFSASAMRALPGVQSIYLNRRLQYLLAESVPSIRADAVHASRITGRGVGIAILDSGIDGLYNPDLSYPTKTVQNVKAIADLRDLFTFAKQPEEIPGPIAQGAAIFIENLPNTETSTGHGTHLAGIAAGAARRREGSTRASPQAPAWSESA